MSRRNRRQREERRQQQLAAQQPGAVQTPAPPAATVSPEQQEELGQLAEWAAEEAEAPKPPRKFGKARVFNLDCGITVTVKGDEETLESEVWPVFEGNELHIYTGDAAIERRIAKQQGIAMPADVAVPIAPRVVAAAPAEVVPEEVRIERALARRGGDAEQAAFNELGLGGINVNEMKRSTAMGAQLAAVPDEEIA